MSTANTPAPLHAQLATMENAMAAVVATDGRLGLRTFIATFFQNLSKLNIVNATTAKSLAHLLYDMYCAPYTPDGILAAIGIPNIDTAAKAYIDNLIDAYFATRTGS